MKKTNSNIEVKVKSQVEEKPRFTISGKNKDGEEFELIPEMFFSTSSRNHKPVIVAEIKNGIIEVGNKLLLKNSSHVLECLIKEIQKNHSNINYAVKGETVGLLLDVKIQKVRRVNQER